MHQSIALASVLLPLILAKGLRAQEGAIRQLFRTSATATTTIGDGANPATILDQIVHVSRSRRGEILVATYKDRLIHRFDERGRSLPPIGRSGGGPGEFLAAPQFTLMANDSVAAFSAGRLSIFTPEGAFARSAQIRAPDQVRGLLLGVAGTSHVLFHDAPRTERGGLRVRDSIEVWRVHSSSAELSRAFIAPREPIPPPVATIRRTGGSVRVQTQVVKPSKPYPASHIVAGAGRVAIVEDSTWKISLRDFSGRALGAFISPNAEASRVRDALANGSLRGWQMLFDSDNRLWVQEALPPARGSSRWTIHGVTGAAIGYAMLPAHIRVAAITPDLIVGTTRDDDDVQSVVVYRLERTR